MVEPRRDIHGNMVDAQPTGRRIVGPDGHFRVEMRRDGFAFWPGALPHADCIACGVSETAPASRDAKDGR